MGPVKEVVGGNAENPEYFEKNRRKNHLIMSKLESLETFSGRKLSLKQMANVTGGSTPTDGGIRPVHTEHSSSGWIYYAGDETTGDHTTYFMYEEVNWHREP